MSNLNQLPIEAKRQSLYACLLTHSPEFGSLRERAVDRLVLGGLLGSSVEKPYKVGEIQKNIHFGPETPMVRPDVISSSLERLRKADMIDSIEIRKKSAYFLKELGIEELGKQLEKASRLFEAVARRMLENTEHLVSYDVGSNICRRFISECFARFGRQIARAVCGESSGREQISSADTRAMIMKSADGFTISEEALTSLEQRCIGFLRSREPIDDKLKFFLTQSYYFSQLIGIEGKKFNPLSEDAFSSAVFYLDTNVIIPGIISLDDRTSLFHELTRIAKQIKIEIRVTRATISETRRVAFDKKQELDTILEKIPAEVLDAWNEDHIISAFLRQREKNSNLTIEDFIAPFDRLPELLAEYGITIDERDESNYPSLLEHVDILKVFNEEALEVRHRPKAQAVLCHDVFHYLLVTEDRQEHQKTWFLSNDRSLVRAAHRVLDSQPSTSPFCFSVVGFLQSISPFVTSAEAEGSLANVFSSFLSDQVMTTAQLFDIQELKLIAEMHGDVLSTPPEKLIQAFDYAKKTILLGRPYQNADVPAVALGIKKFLTSSSDEQRRAIQEANESLQAQLREQRERYLNEEQKRLRKEEELSGAYDENETLKQQVNDISKQYGGLKQEFDMLEASRRALQQDNTQIRDQYDAINAVNRSIKSELVDLRHTVNQAGRIGLVLLSFLISIYRWRNNTVLLNYGTAGKVANYSLFLICILLQVSFFRNWKVAKEASISVFTISLGTICWLWQVADEQYWSAWSSYVQITSSLALVCFLGLSRTAPDPSR